MSRGEVELNRLELREVEVGSLEDGYRPVRLRTSRGVVDCRHYPAPGARHGAVWVGGAVGGWEAPAGGLYHRLCSELLAAKVASLWVRYRQPTSLEESVLDVLAGLRFLQNVGVEAAALIGHSLGGAVVIQAAAASPAVRTVVTLATQGYGATRVAELGPRCSILLVHGRADRVLPASSSEYVYHLATEPRRLVIYPGAGHGLDEVAEEVHRLVHGWIVEELKRNGRRGAGLDSR